MNIDTHVSENDSIESKLVNWKIDKASEIKNTLYTHVLSLLTPSVKSRPCMGYNISSYLCLNNWML